jgi:Protein of unknown function (DUF2798)
MRLSRRFAPFIFGILQAAITTGIATAVATLTSSTSLWEFLARWLVTWATAWVLMLPIVILLAPIIKRAVDSLTSDDVLGERAS